MGKIRVYEAAKSLGLPNELVLECMHHLGVPVKNHMSSVEDRCVELVKEVFTQGASKPGVSLEELAAEIASKAKKEAEKEKKAAAEKKAKEEEEKKKKDKEKEKERKKAPKGKKSADAEPEEAEEAPQTEETAEGPASTALTTAKAGKPSKSAAKKKGKKDRFSQDEKQRDDPDMYSSPARRLDAIRRRKGQLKGTKGTKTTFVQKGGKGQKMRVEAQTPEEAVINRNIKMGRAATVKDLSHETGIKASEIIKYLFKDLSVMATINQGLDKDVIQLVADHFGFEVQFKEETVKEEIVLEKDKPEELMDRPPVVTIMGHVDHGKTKLLDAIRKANVAEGESGGITQHIGAYQIVHKDRPITFLDTPGHESFTALRARGAQVTDVVILVVAADDGVMPQTVEAINHAREAKVPIIVAVNKIDKHQANPDRVKQQLSEHGLQPEEWGGETVFVHISALTREGIPDLLDMVFLVADVQELKANPNRKANGTVIEAQLDRGKGPVATALVQNGTLRAGDCIVAGLTWGKIRTMESDDGNNVKVAAPSTPVKIYGLSEVAMAGDQLIVVENEKVAKEISDKRKLRRREETLSYQTRMSMDQLFDKIQEGKVQELKVIVKGDVQGSIEAIVQSLQGIKHDEVRVDVIHQSVGDVTETDVTFAAASDAVILGFGVGPTPFARALAAQEKVEIRAYDVIYNLIDDVKKALSGLLEMETVQELSGKAEVRALFYSAKAGTIAGCYVTEGEILSNQIVKVERDGRVIYEGKLLNLKRFKEDAKKVAAGYECGISVDGFNECQEGDILSCYTVKKLKRELV